MIPFHLVVPKHGVDCLGVIRISTSRRNKEMAKAHISTGAGFEHVLDIPCIDTWDEDPILYVAAWLYTYGYMDDYFGIDKHEFSLEDFNEEEFRSILAKHKAKVRIW